MMFVCREIDEETSVTESQVSICAVIGIFSNFLSSAVFALSLVVSLIFSFLCCPVNCAGYLSFS